MGGSIGVGFCIGLLCAAVNLKKNKYLKKDFKKWEKSC
jgi:hypothetical protein